MAAKIVPGVITVKEIAIQPRLRALAETGSTYRYLSGLPAVHVLKGECRGCPLETACFAGWPLGGRPDLYIPTHDEPLSTYPDTSYNWGVCMRCWCFWFELKKTNTLYICARLRDGAKMRPGLEQRIWRHKSRELVLAAVVGDSRAEMHTVPPVGYGCTESAQQGKGMRLRWYPEHPRNLSENEREYLDINGALNLRSECYRDDSVKVDDRDCVDFVVRGLPRWLVKVQ